MSVYSDMKALLRRIAWEGTAALGRRRVEQLPNAASVTLAVFPGNYKSPGHRLCGGQLTVLARPGRGLTA